MPIVFENGICKDESTFGSISGGKFNRPTTQFHKQITADGSSGFPAEPGRYHLYFSYACPWAHRTLIFIKLKKLDGIISSSSVEPVLSQYGWKFGPIGSQTEDPHYQYQYVYE